MAIAGLSIFTLLTGVGTLEYSLIRFLGVAPTPIAAQLTAVADEGVRIWVVLLWANLALVRACRRWCK